MKNPDRISLRAAAIQAPPVFMNLEASVARAVELAEEAAADGAKLIVFPETWLPGYPVWLDEAPGAALWDHAPAKSIFRHLVGQAPTCDDAKLAPLREFVERRSGVHLVIGAHERRGGTLYNSIFLIRAAAESSAEVVVLHRKLVPTYSERLIWGRGDGSTLRALETPWGPLGGLVCWEHWMPLARQVLHNEGEAIHVAQWPAVKEMHLVASRHYAFEGRCFVVAAGCALRRGDVMEGVASVATEDDPAWELLREIFGDDETLLQSGGSAIIAPDGRLLAGPAEPDERLLLADLDLAEIAEGRLTLDTAGHYARPDIFRLQVDRRPQRLVADAEIPKNGVTGE